MSCFRVKGDICKLNEECIGRIVSFCNDRSDIFLSARVCLSLFYVTFVPQNNDIMLAGIIDAE